MLGCIIGYHTAVLNAAKIRKFMETDARYPFDGRIKFDATKDYWRHPLTHTLRTLTKQGFLKVRTHGKRTIYKVKNWRKLEDFYHEILWNMIKSHR
jgi:hypothetical protein